VWFLGGGQFVVLAEEPEQLHSGRGTCG
jgi:hypothetical protein